MQRATGAGRARCKASLPVSASCGRQAILSVDKSMAFIHPSVVTKSICSGRLTAIPAFFGPGIWAAGNPYEIRFRKLQFLSASSTTTPDWLSVPLSPGVAM